MYRFALALLGLFCMPVLAQEFRGTLSGRVTDPQNAVTPNVSVQINEINTGSKRSTVTDGEGMYTFPLLSPGSYEVTVETAGFKRYVRRGIQISTNERRTLDIRLEVGQVTDAVFVSADAAMLETASASTGQVINSRQIENMPLN